MAELNTPASAADGVEVASLDDAGDDDAGVKSTASSVRNDDGNAVSGGPTANASNAETIGSLCRENDVQ